MATTKTPSMTTVVSELDRGLTQQEIAEKYQAHPMAISRLVKQVREMVTVKQDLDLTRADQLMLVHAQSLGFINDFLTLLESKVGPELERVKNGMETNFTIKDIMTAIKGLGVNQAVLFDKMRLEKGETTSNMGLLGMVKHFHAQQGLFDPSTGDMRQDIKQAEPTQQHAPLSIEDQPGASHGGKPCVPHSTQTPKD